MTMTIETRIDDVSKVSASSLEERDETRLDDTTLTRRN